jgi:hypothetical protein
MGLNREHVSPQPHICLCPGISDFNLFGYGQGIVMV